MSELVPIELTLTPAVSSVDGVPALAEALETAARRVSNDLGLSLDPKVVVNALIDADQPTPYAFDIAGEPARLIRTWTAASDPDWLPLRLSHDVARNAALFVTDAVVAALRSEWMSRVSRPAACDLDDSELKQLLRECVSLGRGVQRVAEEIDGAEEDSVEHGRSDPRWWPRLERALEAAPSIGVTIPGNLAGEELPTVVAEAVRDRIYETSGVLLPWIDLRFETATKTVTPAGNSTAVLEICDLSTRVPVGDVSASLVDVISAMMRPWLAAFVTRETVDGRMQAASVSLPQLVASVTARFGVTFITRTLRVLVAEGVAIADTRVMLGGLQEIRGATLADEESKIVFHAPAGTPPPALALKDGRLDPEDAADCVRRWARRQITTSKWQSGYLRTRLLSPSLESRLREGTLSPGSTEHRNFLRQLSGSSDPIVTNVDVRRRAFDAIAFERPDVAVLCYQELLPETNITATTRIEL
jgi:hypothetical protein